MPREKEREIQKNTRSALLRPSLLRAKFSDDDVKKCVKRLNLMFKMIKSTLFTESESRANENRSNNEATEHRPC